MEVDGDCEVVRRSWEGRFRDSVVMDVRCHADNVRECRTDGVVVGDGDGI